MRPTKYNPAFMDAAERARRFSGRDHDLAELLRIVRENIQRPRNQHVLVLGARGMGKTTLLLRAMDATQEDAELAAAWCPVIAPEETYRAGTIGEFWLEMVFNLHRATGEARHLAAYETLKNIADDAQLASAARGHLLDFADSQDRRLLLAVENLQMLFGEQVADHDAWALRDTLINEPRIMLLGSATASFKEIEQPKEPLFEQFLLHKLEPFDLDGCLELWERLTGRAESRRRMRALQILTGGNPRLLVVLAEFAADMSLRELAGNLANLIDDHTDYLKMTTEALPALERKVFVALAEIWEYAATARVAHEARIELNTASAQLARLEGRGAVVSRRRGRGKQYRVAERLYCIYHLMRRRGGAASRARAAAEFMAAYYDRPALMQHLRAIGETAMQLDPEGRQEHLLTIDNLVHSRVLSGSQDAIRKTLPAAIALCPESPESLKSWWEQSQRSPAGGAGESFESDTSALPPELRAAHDAEKRARESGPPEAHLAALRDLEGRYRVHLLDNDTGREGLLPGLARVLVQLGLRLSGMGRWDDALPPGEEAVKIYRELAARDWDTFAPNLAMSLNNQGNHLGNLGRRQDALPPTEEAVKIYRELAAHNWDAFASDLARSLNNLGICLGDLGRREDALAPTEEAVKIHRDLAARDWDTFAPGLANSLSNLGIVLRDLGRRQDALPPTEEAVKIYRELAAHNWDTFAPDLAGALNNLGIVLRDLGRREDALPPTEEAVKIRRDLAAHNWGALAPYLASSLNNLGVHLGDLGRREEALAPNEEAVRIRRDLAARNWDTFAPDLAMSLSNLGNRLGNLGRRQDALPPTEEAVRIYRELAAHNWDTFAPDLAGALNNLGVHLGDLGRREEALAPNEEAVRIRRDLAARNWDTFAPDLAMSLNNLGNRLGDLGRREDALPPTEEAVKIRRDLAAYNWDAFAPDLAGTLSSLAIHLNKLGRGRNALVFLQEAIPIYRQCSDRFPAVFSFQLVTCLILAGRIALDIEQSRDAELLFAEAIQLDATNIPARAGMFAVCTAAGRPADALAQLQALAAIEDARPRVVEEVIAATVKLAAKGHGHAVLGVLESSPLAASLEPLIVALRQRVGQDVSAPPEIEEIAADIVEQIEEAASKTMAGLGSDALSPEP